MKQSAADLSLPALDDGLNHWCEILAGLAPTTAGQDGGVRVSHLHLVPTKKHLREGGGERTYSA